MRRFRFLLVLSSLWAVVNCGGSSSPSAPVVTPPTAGGPTAPLTITAVSPAVPIMSAAAQTLTITGTGFQAGLTLTITPPMPPTAALMTFTGAQVLALTSTSFQVSVMLPMAEPFTFQVQNANGEKSNTTTLTPVLRTSGATWIPEGVRMSATDPGGIFDTGIIRLNDGRWRLYYSGSNIIRSAISPDGLSFALEPGTKLAGGNPYPMRLDDGRIRMFYCSPNGFTVLSAISTDDGVTYTAEPGVRLSADAAGFHFITNPAIVRTPTGWRGYFSNGQEGPMTGYIIKSATSPDMLNWTLDGGVRIGAGSALSGTSSHPSAILNANGSVSLFYSREGVFPQSAFFAWTSTSADGLNFTTETQLESLGKVGDLNVVRVGGALRMYYNWYHLYSAISVSGQPQ